MNKVPARSTVFSSVSNDGRILDALNLGSQVITLYLQNYSFLLSSWLTSSCKASAKVISRPPSVVEPDLMLSLPDLTEPGLIGTGDTAAPLRGQSPILGMW